MNGIDDEVLPNKRFQLAPNRSFQSIRGTVLAADAATLRWRSALLGQLNSQGIRRRSRTRRGGAINL